MKIPCPECGSIDVRLSHWKNTWEKTLDLFGVTAVRCLTCGHRWKRSIFRVREFLYARCPRCFRLELGTWDETYYRVPSSWKILTGLGAKKVRCHACRHNFISFRLVKNRVRSDGRPVVQGQVQEEESVAPEA